MRDIPANAERKQLLLARSTLYRLRLQNDATQLRASMATPARGLALVKYLPSALVVFRLVSRGRSGGVIPSILSLVSVVVSTLLTRRGS